MAFYLYRQFVTHYVKTYRKDLGPVMSPFSSVMVDNFESAHNLNPLFSLTIDKPLSLERITKLFDANVIDAQLQNQIRYPELKQYPVNFGGTWFWKNDPNFNVQKHIREWKVEYEPGNLENFSKLQQAMINRPWNPKRSLWELILVNGKNHDARHHQNSYLFLRMHHCMADGKSFVKLLVECFGQKTLKVANANYITNRPLEAAFNSVLFPLHYIEMIKRRNKIAEGSTNHPWNTFNQGKSDIIPKTWVAIAPPISMSKLKTIAKNNSVYPSSVTMTIISGAVAKLYGHSFKRDSLEFSYTLHRPNHPPTLCNHVILGALEFSMEDMSPTLRLRMCNQENMKLKQSEFPKQFTRSMIQVGNFPHGLRRRMIDSKPSFSVGISNFSVEQEGFAIDCKACTNVSVSCGLHLGSTGVAFIAVGYVDKLQISVLGSSIVMTEKEAHELAKEVKNEFDKLCSENDIEYDWEKANELFGRFV